MESRVRVHDKNFRLMIPESEILAAVDRVAEQINQDYRYSKSAPLIVGVLNGSFIFMSDLVRRLEVRCELSFVKISSYDGMSSTGKVRTLLGIGEEIKGRDVIIVEDIVDTGASICHTIGMMREMGAASVRVCTLFFKPDAYRGDERIDYAAMEIGNEFIVGYGLDYDQVGRELRDIYVVEE